MDNEAEERRLDAIVRSSHLKCAAKFQDAFVKYFPHLADIKMALEEWGWLHSHWTLNPIETVRRREAVEELANVVKALKLIATRNDILWAQSLYDAMRAAEADDADLVTQDHGYLAEVILGLLDLYEDHTVRIDLALARLKQAAEQDLSRYPETRNTNWRAVFAVDALRSVWWRNTGRDAPAKALNPASEFASYLQDGFGYLNVTASPVAAFRRWVDWRRTTDRG